MSGVQVDHAGFTADLTPPRRAGPQLVLLGGALALVPLPCAAAVLSGEPSLLGLQVVLMVVAALVAWPAMRFASPPGTALELANGTLFVVDARTRARTPVDASTLRVSVERHGSDDRLVLTTDLAVWSFEAAGFLERGGDLYELVLLLRAVAADAGAAPPDEPLPPEVVARLAGLRGLTDRAGP